jgi:hypothetical protein
MITVLDETITKQIHKTNILIVSYPRSGFHLLQTILSTYFLIQECACEKKLNVNISKIIKKDIAFHRSHDMNSKLNKLEFNKIVILYRKDVVKQLDAFFRYQFRIFDNEVRITDLIKHSKCDELNIAYSEKLDFFRRVFKEYTQWVEKWINTPTPNSIIIEYDTFMKNPHETLNMLQYHLLNSVDTALSSKIVEEVKIEYKHSITPEKYTELKTILDSFKGTIDTKDK